MQLSRIQWTAVALFAAVMTVGEALALQAASQDARRWLAGGQAREIQSAGRAVAAAVAGAVPFRQGECARVKLARGTGAEIRVALREAKIHLREARCQQRVEVLRSREGI